MRYWVEPRVPVKSERDRVWQLQNRILDACLSRKRKRNAGRIAVMLRELQVLTTQK